MNLISHNADVTDEIWKRRKIVGFFLENEEVSGMVEKIFWTAITWPFNWWRMV